jgi:predicted GNAT family acetyltransferase
MDLTIFESADGFLEKAQSWLEAREAENNLILGIALLLRKDPNRYRSEPFLGVITEAGSLVNVAVMTPPHNLVLAGPPQAASLNSLASGLIDQGWSIPGVTGPKETSRLFAKLWSRLTGACVQAGIRMRLYELTRVIQPAGPPGYLYEAKKDEMSLIVDWIVAFQQEALNVMIEREDASRQAERLVSERNLYLWDDGGAVSMAASARPTRHGISVNLVYTPPEQRRKGYASACVAALSQRLLEVGYKFCCLFTDLDNPTSNRIYMEVGYQPVSDHEEHRFVEVTTDPSSGGTG